MHYVRRQKLGQAMQQFSPQFPTPLPGVFADFAEQVLEVIAPALQQFADGIRRFPVEMRPVLLQLHGRGWFISGSMDVSDLRYFQTQLEHKQFEELDNAMSAWVELNLQEVRNNANKRFPERAAIINSAFQAHSDAMYELSVPVFLAQVEGMCLEVLGKKMFSTKAGVPRTRAATDALADNTFTEMLLLPLREVHGLSASASERHLWPESLNRHEILHGVVMDYGTKINSEKAISLLEYIVSLVANKAVAPPSAAT